jgi:hypothetical protein
MLERWKLSGPSGREGRGNTGCLHRAGEMIRGRSKKINDLFWILRLGRKT